MIKAASRAGLPGNLNLVHEPEAAIILHIGECLSENVDEDVDPPGDPLIDRTTPFNISHVGHNHKNRVGYVNEQRYSSPRLS